MAGINGIGGGGIGNLGGIGGSQGIDTQKLQEAVKSLPPELQQKLMELIKQLLGQGEDQKAKGEQGGGGGGGAEKAGGGGGAEKAGGADESSASDLIDQLLKQLAKTNPAAAKQIAQALGKQDPTAAQGQGAAQGEGEGVGGQLGENLAGQSNFEAAPTAEAPVDLGAEAA